MMNRLRKILIPVVAAMVTLVAASGAHAKIFGIGETAFPASAKTFNFTAKSGHLSTPDGSSVLFWGFADNDHADNPIKGQVQYPGPTMILNEGDTVTINLTNLLPEAVSMVFPGLDVTTPTNPVFLQGNKNLLTSMVPEASANGGAQTYTFTASRPGTYYYQSGSNQAVQLRMGLFGAIIVRPAQNGTAKSIGITAHGLNDPGNSGSVAASRSFSKFAYNDNATVEALSTGYDREYLYVISEMDPKFNSWMEFEAPLPVNLRKSPQFDLSKWKANYWFVNGRCASDNLADPYTKMLPTQPYNASPLMHPGETVLVRFVNMGGDPHPFHTHGNHMRVVAEDGRLLQSSGGSGADLSWLAFTLTLQPGKTNDVTFTWTGEKLGWDIYGHKATDPPAPYEYLADHGKSFTPNRPAVNGVAQTPAPPQALPVILPTIEELMFGMWASGEPFLGSSGQLPPGEGGMNPFNGFFYMWHSHAERELTNNNIFPGGLMTMLGIVPWPPAGSMTDNIDPATDLYSAMP